MTSIKKALKEIAEFRKETRQKRVLRECLRCHKMFKSVGKFNRICKSCKKAEVYQGAFKGRFTTNRQG